MSNDRIFIRFKGRTLGPMNDQKVRDLVRRGQITRMHELSSDGLSWQRAEEFGDLFQQQRTTVAATGRTPTPARPAEPAPRSGAISTPRAGDPPEDQVEWYVNINGENNGPISTSTLSQWMTTGNVQRDTLLWRPGYENWLPAAECFPDKFGSAEKPQFAVDGVDVETGAGSDLSPIVIDHFARQRPWTLFISISLMVVAGLFIVYFVTAMIVGAEAKWVPFRGSWAVIYGLFGLIGCGLAITAAIMLLKYASSLRVIVKNPTRANLSISINRLHGFWQFCGIVLLIYQALFIGGAILMAVMVAASVQAVT